MMKKKREGWTQLEWTCYQIYTSSGQNAVYKYVLKRYPYLMWTPCTPCEDETPIDPQTGNCLVCGTPTGDR
jgi:hypothetical protein